MSDLAQVLSLAGIDEAWIEYLQREGVHKNDDLLYVSESWLKALGLSFSDAHQLQTVAGSVCAAGGLELYLDIAMSACIKQAEVQAFLETTKAQLEEGPVQDCVARALKHLEITGPRNAALALTCATRAHTLCKENDAARTLVGEARIAVRDVLAWRVQLACVWGNRDAFLQALEQAYGGRPLDNLSISRVLLSHNHAVAELFPSAFLSQCKYEAEQRGSGRCRPAKKKRYAPKLEGEMSL
jgi:hypothetical protein